MSLNITLAKKIMQCRTHSLKYKLQVDFTGGYMLEYTLAKYYTVQYHRLASVHQAVRAPLLFFFNQTELQMFQVDLSHSGEACCSLQNRTTSKYNFCSPVPSNTCFMRLLLQSIYPSRSGRSLCQCTAALKHFSSLLHISFML